MGWRSREGVVAREGWVLGGGYQVGDFLGAVPREQLREWRNGNGRGRLLGEFLEGWGPVEAILGSGLFKGEWF